MKRLSYLLAGIIFIGCGGGSNSSNNTISGVVADGYVKGAKVCIDINSNLKCDENEPYTITQDNGSYILTLPENKNYILISQGGIDTETGKKAITMYSNTKYKNITPLTTLAITQGEEYVSRYFNISISDIAKDPMRDNEIKNITDEIVKELEQNNTLMQNIQTPTPSLIENPPSTIETNTTIKDETNTSENTQPNDNINETNETEDIPSQLSGDTLILPPQIGVNQ